MTSKSSLKAYPSGFLGSSEITQSVSTKEDSLTKAVGQIFNKVSSTESDGHTSSQEINTIWTNIINDSNDCNSFEFKESILKIALSCFGTDTFSQWLSVQHSNLEFTKEHHKFIDETINYIYYGKKREISFNNWFVLLNGSNVETITNKYSDLQNEWLLKPNGQTTKINASKTINEFILDWVNAPKGINDLAASLFILFGLR